MKLRMLSVRNRYLFVADILLNIIAYMVFVLFVFPLQSFSLHLLGSCKYFLVSCISNMLFMFVFDNYRVMWSCAAFSDCFKLLLSACCTFFCSFFLSAVVGISSDWYLKNVAGVNMLCSAFVILLRMFLKFLQESVSGPKSGEAKNVLIVGAGKAAVILLRELALNPRLNYRVVGLADDDPNKMKQNVYGYRVLGDRYQIEDICAHKQVDEIIYSIHNISAEEQTKILDICAKTECALKIFPEMHTILDSTFSVKNIRKVQIEDLLGRDCVSFDMEAVRRDLTGKTVLVTGGGGSIGSELCRQIVPFQPAHLIILDIYENTTYDLENELRELYPKQKISVCIGSVRDKNCLEHVFATYRPDVVFHAAAHKHVPLMENNPAEAIKNNVFGTYNVAQCADRYSVKRFVMISTDKAVNPTNVMGATKRMCEMIIQVMDKTSQTEFVAVRFGNVLNSNGSVIPRFKKQIEAGGPVTVTHPEITRFFMTIPEASRLVLRAAEYARGGEVFVLDMGSPVKIYDLAKKMIHLSGLEIGRDIEIVFTGLRPGEKLYEELLMSEEGLRKTDNKKIFIGSFTDITPQQLQQKLTLLQSVLDKDAQTIKQAMQQVVPTYCPKIESEQIEKMA